MEKPNVQQINWHTCIETFIPGDRISLGALLFVFIRYFQCQFWTQEIYIYIYIFIYLFIYLIKILSSAWLRWFELYPNRMCSTIYIAPLTEGAPWRCRLGGKHDIGTVASWRNTTHSANPHYECISYKLLIKGFKLMYKMQQLNYCFQ